MESDNNKYWPGFVDALSNMVMAMIFIVLTFVVVLFGVMQNNLRAVATRMAEMRMVEGRYQKTVSELQRENTELRAQLAAPRAGTSPVIRPGVAAVAGSPGQRTTASLTQAPVTVVSNGRDVRNAQPTGRLPPLVSGGGDVITIVYPSSQSALDGPTRASLDQVTAQRLVHPGSVRAEIIADIAGAAAATDSQRLAYFRALEARNYLLARGLSPASITVRLIARPTDDGRGRVLIRLSGG